MEVHEQLGRNMLSNDMYQLAKTLHDNYQPFMLDCQVWDLLQKVIPSNLYSELIAPYKKTIIGHKIVNNIVMNTYFGERKVKYHFSRKYMDRPDETSVFEFNVGSSRLDYARLNGHSYAYEIKTELDTLDKLDKQIADYSKVFEYVHVVCHPDHYKKVLAKVPEYCGIITYNTEKKEFPFSFRKKRILNSAIDPNFQLSALTTKELEKILKVEGMQVPGNRSEREEQILNYVTKNRINHHFKETVKRRFRSKWVYLCENINAIEPMDIQPFFKSQANPFWVYYKNSSMV